MKRFLCLAVLAAAPASAQSVAVSPADCRQLVAHEAAADTAYRPGVDVRGRPVEPADLPGSTQVAVPDSFSIPITVELDERLGIPVGGDAAFSAEAEIGRVEVDARGNATFNGQPLGDEQARLLRAACAEALAPR